jgi:hypothetical protein
MSVLLVTACTKKPEAPDTDMTQGVEQPAGEATVLAEPGTVAAALTPHQIEVSKNYFTGSVSVDDSLFAAAPELAADLIADSRVRIEAMDEDARTYKEADPEYFNPFSLSIVWTLVAQAGDLISIEGFTGAYSGGAHGNYGTDARIYDVKTKAGVSLRDLMADADGAIAASLPVILANIAGQRSEKVGGGQSTDTFRSEAADAISADGILEGEIGLAASTEPGRFGGFVVHFAPYEIGSYAEGPYKVTVPQAVFHDFLKPEYAALFAGDPVTEE